MTKYYENCNYESSSEEEYRSKSKCKRGKRGYPGFQGPQGPTGPSFSSVYGEALSFQIQPTPPETAGTGSFNQVTFDFLEPAQGISANSEPPFGAVIVESSGVYQFSADLEFRNSGDTQAQITALLFIDGVQIIQREVTIAPGNGDFAGVANIHLERIIELSPSAIPAEVALFWVPTNSGDISLFGNIDTVVPSAVLSVVKLDN